MLNKMTVFRHCFPRTLHRRFRTLIHIVPSLGCCCSAEIELVQQFLQVLRQPVQISAVRAICCVPLALSCVTELMASTFLLICSLALDCCSLAAAICEILSVTV
jgi:hypothetical protein